MPGGSLYRAIPGDARILPLPLTTASEKKSRGGCGSRRNEYRFSLTGEIRASSLTLIPAAHPPKPQGPKSKLEVDLAGAHASCAVDPSRFAPSRFDALMGQAGWVICDS